MTDLTDATNLELATRINDIVTKCAYIDSRMTNAEVQVFNEAARRLAERGDGVELLECLWDATAKYMEHKNNTQSSMRTNDPKMDVRLSYRDDVLRCLEKLAAYRQSQEKERGK